MLHVIALVDTAPHRASQNNLVDWHHIRARRDSLACARLAHLLHFNKTSLRFQPPLWRVVAPPLSRLPSKMDTSYLAQQVNTIIGQLHGLFDEIGVPNHDREIREAEVCLTTPTMSLHPYSTH